MESFMTRNQKIFIGVGAGIVVLCLGACAVVLLFFRGLGNAITNSANKSPAEVQAAANNIAVFDLPAGYAAAEGMEILGITVAVFKSSSSDVFIMLMEMPTAADLSDANFSQMQLVFDRQFGSQGYQMHVVQTKDVTVRGKPGKIFISEGTANGKNIRQVTVFFHGNHGMAAFFITGPISQWDTAAYDQMIRSIR
jgi:hypothetical protein